MVESQDVLNYHSHPTPGKISVHPTKPCLTQHDLSLAYTPGVAIPCLEIHKCEDKVFDYTSKGNLVAVVTNGTAVLGLGNIGPKAGKPVDGGQGGAVQALRGHRRLRHRARRARRRDVLQRGQGDVTDVRRHQPRGRQGARVLRDRERLKRELDIPVFHDDQHGTAIITSAGL
jgi:malate dehydrogenase (oxaloacetate-decarboxylating)(NADP+)